MLRPFRGRVPRVHPTAYIDDSAQVIGDVEIGEASSVWMAVVIRGDVHRTRIGCRSNVQDGTVVHVMKDTHATTIGDDVTIGRESIVAAGTLIVEGMQVPPRSLVMGSPGRVKRPLTEAEVAEIQMYADRYVQYRVDYMGAGGSRL